MPRTPRGPRQAGRSDSPILSRHGHLALLRRRLAPTFMQGNCALVDCLEGITIEFSLIVSHHFYPLGDFSGGCVSSFVARARSSRVSSPCLASQSSRKEPSASDRRFAAAASVSTSAAVSMSASVFMGRLWRTARHSSSDRDRPYQVVTSVGFIASSGRPRRIILNTSDRRRQSAGPQRDNSHRHARATRSKIDPLPSAPTLPIRACPTVRRTRIVRIAELTVRA